MASPAENGAEPEEARPLDDGFAIHTVGKRPKKSRVIGGSSSRRDRLEGARMTADFVGDADPSPRLVDASQVENSETVDRSASQIDALDALEARVTRLSSVCEAMWQVISAELEIDIDRLTAMLKQMDGGDTALEDRDADETVCPNCGNRKPSDQKLCLFCSAGIAGGGGQR